MNVLLSMEEMCLVLSVIAVNSCKYASRARVQIALF